MRLVLLHHPNGEELYVNPDHVLTIERDGRGPGSLIAFAVAGRSWRDESSCETEPYRVATSETPDEVILLLTGLLLVSGLPRADAVRAEGG